MKVVPLCPCQHISKTLRYIADSVDKGELEGDATIVIGTKIFHVGQVHSDQAVKEAIWDMTYAIHKLMSYGLDSAEQLESA